MRRGWIVVALVAGSATGLAVGSIALGDSPGPTLSIDQGFNSGQAEGPGFPPDGSVGTAGGVIYGSVIQPDGKIVVVGQNPVVSGSTVIADFDVARFNPDGTLDSTFGQHPGGGYEQVAPTPGGINDATSVALDPQTGDIVIGGGEISHDVPELVRLTPGGVPDTNFGTGGSVVDNADAGSSYLTGLVVDSSSRIVTIGSDGVVRRYAANGTVDTSFASPTGHTGQLITPPGGLHTAIASQPADGKILVAGAAPPGGTRNAGTVVRLNTDGTLDPTFGSGGAATVSPGGGSYAVTSIAIEGTSIVTAGSEVPAQDTILARLTSGGQLDTTFGTSGFDTFPPPSGFTSTGSQVVFYDPHPGLPYCFGATGGGNPDTTFCGSTGVDGGNASTPMAVNTGGTFNGAAAFNPATGALDVAAYSQSLLIASDLSTGGSTSTITSTSTSTSTGTTPCAPVDLTILKEVIPNPSSEWYITTTVKYLGNQRYEAAAALVGEYAGYTPEIAYQITVKNVGECDATDVGISDKLSSDFEFSYLGKEDNGLSTVVDEPKSSALGGDVAIAIPSLPHGQQVTFWIAGELRSRFSTNTAFLAAADFGGQHSSISVKKAPATNATIGGANSTSTSGRVNTGNPRARDAQIARTRGSQGAPVRVKAVYVAIVRMSGHKGGRCLWLRTTNARFNRSSCRRPIWLPATGTTEWQLSYRRLPKGRYEALAMALGTNGLSADSLTARAGDAKIFTVR